MLRDRPYFRPVFRANDLNACGLLGKLKSQYKNGKLYPLILFSFVFMLSTYCQRQDRDP